MANQAKDSDNDSPSIYIPLAFIGAFVVLAGLGLLSVSRWFFLLLAAGAIFCCWSLCKYSSDGADCGGPSGW